MFNTDFLYREYFGNTVQQYLLFCGILVVGFVLKKMVSKLLSQILFNFFKRQFVSVGMQKFTELLQRPFSFFIIVITLFVAFLQLVFPTEWHIASENEFGVRRILWMIFESALLFSIVWVLIRLVEYFGLVLKYKASLTDTALDDQLVPFIKEALKIFIALVGFFFLFGKIFDINIAALLGGAGIAGLAIALAAQETLGNLLGSFTIFLDKPFRIGDSVRIGTVQGTVESIGFRSTRIRSLEKSIITVPNKKMVDAELDNLTERELFRGRILIGLRYDTKLEPLKAFIAEIKSRMDAHDQVDNNAIIRFHEMQASCLEVLIQFFAKANTMEEYLNIKEQMLFMIMEIAEKNNMKFAFPSTSVYMEPNSNEKLSQLV